MAKCHFALVASALTLSIATLAAPVQAAVGFGVTLLSPRAAEATTPQSTCKPFINPQIGPSTTATQVQISKSSAILGGQVSRLELIRMQQAQGSSANLAPAAGPASRLAGAASQENCQKFAAVQVSSALTTATPGPRATRPDDFLASKRLPVRHTSFTDSWQRVRNGGLSRSTLAAVAATSSGRPDRGTLAAVNAWTNGHIRYVEDQRLYGTADYWASARETLRRRAGDCEDIAIAKMQLLAGLGVPRSDMYLTIARDLVRNADHALLVVRQDDRYWLLDNATDSLLDASEAHDYRPIMSFSADRQWLHGY